MKKKQLPALALIVSCLFFPALACAASLMLGPGDFMPTADDQDFTKGINDLRNNSHLLAEDAYLAAVHLPDGARVNRAVVIY